MGTLIQPARAIRAAVWMNNRHPARTWMLVTGGLGLAAAGAGSTFAILLAAASSFVDMSSSRRFQALVATAGAAAGIVWSLIARPGSAFYLPALFGAALGIVLAVSSRRWPGETR